MNEATNHILKGEVDDSKIQMRSLITNQTVTMMRTGISMVRIEERALDRTIANLAGHCMTGPRRTTHDSCDGISKQWMELIVHHQQTHPRLFQMISIDITVVGIIERTLRTKQVDGTSTESLHPLLAECTLIDYKLVSSVRTARTWLMLEM